MSDPLLPSAGFAPSPPEAGDAVVEMHGIDLTFNGHPILRQLDLSILRGERMVILGQSGAGKSTLLRLILGVLRPNAGRVCFNHLDLSRLPRTRLNQVRTRIGMVYQQAALISSLSVRDNLALPLEELSLIHI